LIKSTKKWEVMKKSGTRLQSVLNLIIEIICLFIAGAVPIL